MNSKNQFSKFTEIQSVLWTLLLAFLAGNLPARADALASYEPMFGAFVQCEDDLCETKAFGVFDRIATPWLHHQQMGWIYAEPEFLGNWFYAVERGWWYSKAEWLPWIWSDFLGWCYYAPSRGIIPVEERPLPAEPNILVILTDDQGYADLGCYGATDFETPAIDGLAASGARFTAGYVTSPQCAPSRAGLISGVQPIRFGYIHNSSHEGLPERERAPTIAEQLRDRGYVTGMIGKWHIGFVLSEDSDEYGVTLPGNYPWERGFDYVLKHEGGGSHYFPYSESGRHWMLSRGREPRLLEKREEWSQPDFIEDLPPETYLTDYFSEEAVNFIHRNEENPWFLFLSYNAPHTPMNAKPEVLQKYEHIEDSLRRTFIAMMDSLDEGVGRVMDALRETGQLENTLVWFLSDNGAPTEQNSSRNDPFSGLKGDMHEGGIRVPFIVSWPGAIPAGRVLHDPVISLDILPTSLAAAGMTSVPDVYDGKDLLPWLRGLQNKAPNSELYWRWVSRSAVRVGDLKETRNSASVLAIDGSVVPGHVFSNLRKNPWEYPHLAPPSAEEKSMLSEKLDTWLRQIERDQTFLIPGSVAPEWMDENVVFSTEFLDAVQPGGLSNPIEAGGHAADGFEVSAVTPGPGIQAFRIDDSVSWTRFISESAGSSVAQTAQQAIDQGAYFEITITAQSPHDFTGLWFGMRGHGATDTGGITLRSSADGYAKDIVSVSGPLNRVHFTSADLAALNEFRNRTEVTFQFYIYDSFSGPNNRRIGLEEIKISAVPSD